MNLTNLTPVRGKIKAGTVAKLKDSFDKLIGKAEGEDLPALKRLKRSGLHSTTPRNKHRKSSRSSAKKKVIVDSNQSLIIDFYRGKLKEEMEPEVVRDDMA